MITLTCGHQIHDIDYAVEANLKGWTRENTPCLEYVVYCEDCYNKALDRGDVLLTYDDEASWLAQIDEENNA